MKISDILKLSAAAFSALFLLSGCVRDISDRQPGETYFTTKVSKTSETTTTTTSQTTTATTTSASSVTTTPATSDTTEASSTRTPISNATFTLTDEHREFLENCVFVGDSICSGLKHYEILPAEQVHAQGSVAARNIFDYTFKYDDEQLSIINVLVNLKPEYIVFSMGMNDVNMTSENKYCENYEKLLSMIESFLPDTKLIVCSITPISSDSTFTTNEKIDGYNTAIKNYIENGGKKNRYYVNIAHALKNSENCLKEEYSAGDGLHIGPLAYNAILYQLSEQMVDGVVYPDPHNDVPNTTVQPE